MKPNDYIPYDKLIQNQYSNKPPPDRPKRYEGFDYRRSPAVARWGRLNTAFALPNILLEGQRDTSISATVHRQKRQKLFPRCYFGGGGGGKPGGGGGIEPLAVGALTVPLAGTGRE